MRKLFHNRKNLFTLLIISFSIFVMAMIPFHPDEGMYPLSEIRKLDLKDAGLKIDIDEVYNPNGVSLVDALVKVGGCTGSFVSQEGLIITNHHCAFGSVQRVSTVENNYLENGFLAKTKADEISAEGLTCRITESYEDVSEIVLKAADEAKDINERAEAISQKIKEIVAEEEEKDPTIEASVSEMFTGQSYVLFRYKVIRDVRLVYVPPRAIGEFGGESDNWVWPRHTGDFSFMRAYVAPDGSSNPYSEENVPYHPKRFLKVNPNGVNDGDFVFILGYPGRTYKHQPSQFLTYQQDYQLPYIQNLYSWIIDRLIEKGENDPEIALDVASRIKGLANVEKNYRGKMVGLDRLDLVEKKKAEEKQLQEFINSNPELKEKYGNVLAQINDVYNEIFESGSVPLILSQMGRNLAVFRGAELLLNYQDEMKKPDSGEKTKALQNIKRAINYYYSNYYPDVEREVAVKILSDAQTFPEFENTGLLINVGSIEKFVNDLYDNTGIEDKDKLLELFDKSSEDIQKLNDPMIEFAGKVKVVAEKEDKKREEVNSKLNILLAKFMEVKRIWMNKTFIPDANGTLRLTYGYIKGYSPADAVYYSPITTLKGVVEKGEDEGDYKIPQVIRDLYAKKDFGRFKSKELDDVPVAILYNTDTSGGNSGSPIMNAYGEIIGVNFDRPFEATINDFVYSKDYSRSLGVDIRYVLWIAQKVSGADNIIREMGVDI